MPEKQDLNDNVVLAIYRDEKAAQSAIDGLKMWDRVNEEIKLGAIGTITKEGGKIKTHVPRKIGKGAKVGAAVGVIAGVLSGGVTLLGGLAGGSVVGAITGTFFKKSMHLSKAEIEDLGRELDAGRAAVVVTCDSYEVDMVKSYLSGPGIQVRIYAVPEEALAETAQAMQAAGELPADDA